MSITGRKTGTSLIFAALASLIILGSCDKEDKYIKEENTQIQNYLSSNSDLNFIQQSSGLYYLEVEEGTGVQAAYPDTAYVYYTGKFLDGEIFGTNLETTDTLIFPIDQGWMIEGFDEGITLMKEGGKATLLIPSELAYGSEGRGAIPGYTPLLFELDLVKITPGP